VAKKFHLPLDRVKKHSIPGEKPRKVLKINENLAKKVFLLSCERTPRRSLEIEFHFAGWCEYGATTEPFHVCA
jgi:hypothetical protein